MLSFQALEIETQASSSQGESWHRVLLYYLICCLRIWEELEWLFLKIEKTTSLLYSLMILHSLSEGMDDLPWIWVHYSEVKVIMF
jgi:hypothetical protein